jgi:nitrite reductase/ring-hydroxylating ferredoxin subunit
MSEPSSNKTGLPEPAWIRLIRVASCRSDAGTFVERDGKELGVFVLGPGQVFVIDNACPHAGGNLSAGDVAEGVVTCPWHQWQFDLSTGVCTDSAAARVQKYPARIRDEWVEIQTSHPCN